MDSALAFPPVQAAIEKQLAKRDALVVTEKRLRSDAAFRATLSPVAQRACAITGRIRAVEQQTVWRHDPANPLPESERFGSGPRTELYPGMSFNLAKARMEATKLWRITKRMSKGALLHCHSAAMVDLDWVYAAALGTNGMYLQATAPLDTMQGRDSATVRCHFFKESAPKDVDPCAIWTANYVPLTWVPLAEAAECFPDGGTPGFISWLKSRTAIRELESIEHHLGVDDVWRKFSGAFGILASIIYYEPIMRGYMRRLLEQLIDDGVQWVELRESFEAPFFAAGSEVPEPNFLALVRLIQEEVEDFKKSEKGKGFWGARIIWTTLRFLSPERIFNHMNQCILAKQNFPSMISGFDLAGQEDGGHSHKTLTPQIVWFRERCTSLNLNIPFFFHAGECLGDGNSTDGNLFDVIELGTRRIGHAFSLYKHPVLIDRVKEADILVESCPISNEVLRLTNTVLAHPLPALLSRGVAASLSNDDPALLGQGTAGMSHDFWVTLQAWENLGLAGLGSLAENSIRWAAFEDETDEEWLAGIRNGGKGRIKGARLEEWRRSWEEFCAWVVVEFGEEFGEE